MKLLLIRHAESNGNAANGDYSIDNADALSPKGLAQADALASCLASWKIGTVIASPQRRALQTITPYLAATDKKAEVWPELAEACWHEEREPPTDTWKTQPTALPYDIAQYFYFRDGKAIRPGRSETFGNGLRRVNDALELIEKRYVGSEQTVLMASHNFFISETINLMLNVTDPETFDHDNCGMTLMSFDTEWKMEFCNRLLTQSEVSRTTRM